MRSSLYIGLHFTYQLLLLATETGYFYALAYGRETVNSAAIRPSDERASNKSKT